MCYQGRLHPAGREGQSGGAGCPASARAGRACSAVKPTRPGAGSWRRTIAHRPRHRQPRLQQYFGKGSSRRRMISARKESASHPELLDWLACELLEPAADRPANRWSLKHLHRLILTSAAYRQSSQARPDCATSTRTTNCSRASHGCVSTPRSSATFAWPQPTAFAEDGRSPVNPPQPTVS